jgi:acyl-CoA thioesterase-1
MSKISLVLIVFFSVTLWAAEAKRLVIIGDSITEGYGIPHSQAYPSVLQKLMEKNKKNWRVLNSGISGSTSASAVERVKWHLRQKPNMILLALGASDGLQGQNIKKMENNLTAAIQACKKTSVKIVLAGFKLPPNYDVNYAKAFAAVFPRIAAKENVPFIPSLLAGVTGVESLNQSDGIHPNEKGHALVAETVYKGIEKLL